MKVRVCPKCGKHNLENAWSCADCGQTLSMNTLVDTGDFQTSQAPIAGKSALSSISPHFHHDVAELLDTIIQGDESVIRGCNITRLSRGAPFTFGYLIATSQRLVCVHFAAETKRFGLRPNRSCLEVWPTRGTRTPALAVDYPTYPLTPEEKASRKVAIHDLENLVSADLVSIGYTEISLMSLTVRFRQGKETTVTFYAPHEAEETYKLLATRLGK